MESVVQEGLAIYAVGEGEPLLRMPAPHGYTVEPTAEDQLTRLLVGLGRRVITFDPPGAFRSTRPARVDLVEMLEGARQALNAFSIERPVDLLGHSMGGFCSLAFALEEPARVRRMVLVGAVSGGPAVQRGGGLPWYWRWSDPDFWRFIWWGSHLASGRGSLATHKRMVQLIRRISVADPSRPLPAPVVEHGDERLPAPIRDRWPVVARRLDFSARLREVSQPTLICVGQHDPQAPTACSRELAAGIPGSILHLFEQSGHYPYHEEPELFAGVVARFLNG